MDFGSLRACPILDSKIGNLPECADTGYEHCGSAEGVGGDHKIERRKWLAPTFQISAQWAIKVCAFAIPVQHRYAAHQPMARISSTTWAAKRDHVRSVRMKCIA